MPTTQQQAERAAERDRRNAAADAEIDKIMRRRIEDEIRDKGERMAQAGRDFVSQLAPFVRFMRNVGQAPGAAAAETFMRRNADLQRDPARRDAAALVTAFLAGLE